MLENLPLIETVSVFDTHVNGVCQLDKIGPDCAITFCGLRLDPAINGGRLFRTPLVRVTWAYENLLQQKGTVARWIESGPPEGSLLVPLFPDEAIRAAMLLM